MAEGLLSLLILVVAAVAAAITIAWELLTMNGELCQPKIVAVLTALSGMLGVVLGSFIGRRIEHVRIARRKREQEDEPTKL